MVVNTKKARLLNAVYAIARTKRPLTEEEKALLRTAARMLERAMGIIKELRARSYDMEEQLAIMLEGQGLLKDPDTGVPPSEAEMPQDDWEDDWPIHGYPTR